MTVDRSRPAQRLRAWLALWCVSMLAVCYIAGWAFWSYTHQNLGFVQLQPGAPSVTGKGSPFRVLSIQQSTTVPGSTEGSEPFVAAPGMTFVLVRFEVTRRSPDEVCLLKLAAADGINYDYSTKLYGRKLKQYCSDFPEGVPTVGEIPFEVPLSRVDRIAGLYALDQRDWRSRHLVATQPH